MKTIAETYCDSCMCQNAACDLIENARIWIRQNADSINGKLFEDAAKGYPGAFRPFMMAWCDEFGGV